MRRAEQPEGEPMQEDDVRPYAPPHRRWAREALKIMESELTEGVPYWLASSRAELDSTEP